VSNYDAASVPTNKDRAVLTRINETLSMSNVLVVYWAIYWLMNGLDKFLNRKDLGIFTWYGKDRTEQFSGYFSNSAIPESWINSLLYLVGFWEILIFLCLAKSLSTLMRHSQFDTEWLKLGMNLGAITFVIFSFFDVIFGDRAELLEHGTFLILVVWLKPLKLISKAYYPSDYQHRWSDYIACCNQIRQVLQG